MNREYLHGYALAKKSKGKVQILETPYGLGDFVPVLAEGTTKPRMLKDRFADVVNVKDFGAVGDGVTDDSESIKKAIVYAIDADKSLNFSAGSYNVKTPIYIAKAGRLHIEGSGATLTTTKDTPIALMTLCGEKIADGIDYPSSIDKGSMLIKNVFGRNLRVGDLIHIETTEMIPTDYRIDWHNGFLVRVNRISSSGVHISDPFPYRVQAKKTHTVSVGDVVSAFKVKLPSLSGSWEDLRLFVKFRDKKLYISEWDNETKIATFTEDISGILHTGDSITLESKNTCTVYRPIKVTVDGLNFYKKPQIDAIEGTGGYRGLDIHFGNECEVHNSSITNFSETNLRFVMSYKCRAIFNCFEGGNRIHRSGPYKADGIGYGICVSGGGYHVIQNNVFKSNRASITSANSACRSVDCIVENNVFYAPEGLSYAGLPISPETPIDESTSLKSYAFGGHGDALRWTYKDNTIVDYPVGSSIRDEESIFIGNVFLGKIFRALKFESVYGATAIANIYKPSNDFNHSRMIRFTLGQYRKGKRILVENNIAEGIYGPLIDIGLNSDTTKNVLTDFVCRGNRTFVRQGGLEPMCGGIGANFKKEDFKISSDCVFENNSIQYSEEVSRDKRVGFLGVGYSWDINEGVCLKIDKNTFIINLAANGGKTVIPRESRATGVSVIDVYAPFSGNIFGIAGIMYQNGYDLNPSTKSYTDKDSGTAGDKGRVKVAPSADLIQSSKPCVWLYNTGTRAEIGICNTMDTQQYVLVHIKDAGVA